MALSYITYTGDGSTRDFTFPFMYLDVGDIGVYVGATPVAFTLTNASAVKTTVAPSTGSVVRVRRMTSKLSVPVNFSDGSNLLERDLDLLGTWTLYQSQEAADVSADLGLIAGQPLSTAVAAAVQANISAASANSQANASAASAAASATSLSNLTAAAGSSLIGFRRSEAGAATRTVLSKMLESISIRDFGAVGDGITDDTQSIRNAIAAVVSGGSLYIPPGEYLVSSSLKLPNSITVFGAGESSRITIRTDIEVFNSDTSTASALCYRVVLQDFMIASTVTSATTMYAIHLTNPEVCTLRSLHIQSGHTDSMYSSTNKGGIWLERPAASTTASFMNLVENCWLQNNSVFFDTITDSVIRGGYIWGHTRQFAIRIRGGGANAVEHVEGIICSKFNGGIWIDGAGVNQVRIIGNEFDGNPALDTGTGVYCPQQAIAILVSGNTFWGCDKHGIDVTDPVCWSITGNVFWKNNASDNFYDDIRITGVAFSPNGNVVSGNSFTIDEARTNKGYAIREVNGGSAPVSNVYAGNGVTGLTGYAVPSILVLSYASASGNSGMGADTPSRITGTLTRLGVEGLTANVSADIAIGGTLDMPVNAGGFSGTLSIAATRTDYPPQSRRVVYSAMAYGTTALFTQQAVQDGSGGGTSFTLTMVSAGVVRYTNTSGNPATVRMAFFGNASYG